MSDAPKESQENPEGLTLERVTVPDKVTYNEAQKYLESGDAKEFLRRVAYAELYDYSPLDAVLQKLTTTIHVLFSDKVSVIPRGSYVSRTALTDSADLDIDLLIPQDTELTINGKPIAIKTALGVNPDLDTITFEKDKLVAVLNSVWDKIKRDKDASKWLTLVNEKKAFTRSIPAKTKDKIDGINRPLEIDLFIKVRVKRGPFEYVVGVDKDGPDQLRRIQTTDYIPVEGKWIGDRILHSAERCAIIMLKWWKLDKQIPIKSHHLLSALNQLYQLNEKDPLWLPPNVYTPFSNLRVMEIMRGILIYIHYTYGANPCGFLLTRTNAKGEKISDYPIPEVNRDVQDNMFIQFNQEEGGKYYEAFKKKDFTQDLEQALKKACDNLRHKK